jgi:hypothetical protein
MIAWHELWKLRLREKIDNPLVWQDEIAISLPRRKITANMMCAAVRRVADQKQRGLIPYAPTIQDLIACISFREQDEQEDRDRLARIQDALRAAASNEDRWNMICDYGRSLADLIRIERWAKATLGFRRPVPTSERVMKEALRTAKVGLRDVSEEVAS